MSSTIARAVIKEHCYIRNRLNGNTTSVGNMCVNRFFGIRTATLFDGVKRIARNTAANANESLIRHAQNCGYLYDGEHEFLMQTRRKRKLSAKQEAWREKISRRIVQEYRRAATERKLEAVSRSEPHGF